MNHRTKFPLLLIRLIFDAVSQPFHVFIHGLAMRSGQHPDVCPQHDGRDKERNADEDQGFEQTAHEVMRIHRPISLIHRYGTGGFELHTRVAVRPIRAYGCKRMNPDGVAHQQTFVQFASQNGFWVVEAFSSSWSYTRYVATSVSKRVVLPTLC